MHKNFIKALVWNSSTAFIYKIALLSHQIVLYSIISHTLYGLQSSLFAAIYTIIALTNFGFEETLLPFFSTFSQSKQQFLQIRSHFMWHIVTVACIALIFYMTLMHGTGEFLHNARVYCNKNIIFIVVMIFFVESFKKSLVAMMQLAFLNKQIAYAEITMLMTYITTVWVIFSIQGQLTLYAILMPMLITSTLELFYLLYHFVGFYKMLPECINTSHISLHIIFKERIYNYINQIAKTIYSPNSMTILFAYLLGFQQAATIKLFTNIITLCYTCISKSIGVTTGATFSAMNQMPLSAIQSFFKDVTQRYFQLLYILSCVIWVIVGYSYYFSIITGIMAIHILLFFGISFLEHVSITYEQLFMTQYAANILAAINCIGLVILSVCSYAYACNAINQITIICLFFMVKLACLKILSTIAQHRWAISL